MAARVFVPVAVHDVLVIRRSSVYGYVYRFAVYPYGGAGRNRDRYRNHYRNIKVPYELLTMSTKTADVIVIGGGVIGTSIAYHLAREKVDVLVVEREGLAAGSSGACDGLVLVQSKKPGIHLTLARAGIARFRELTGELPSDIEFKQDGALVVISSEEELAAMERFVSEQERHGLDIRLLDTAQTRELEPCLSPAILGATFCPVEGQINPMALTHAFARGAVQAGARIVCREAVREITTAGGVVSGVVTDSQVYSAGTVVNAAGAYAAEIGRMVGLDVPIKPRRGQLLVTETVPPILNRCLVSANYIAAKFDPEIATRAGGGVSIEQTMAGSFLLGSTREFVGFDRRTTIEAHSQIARRTTEIIPGLKKRSVVRAFAGLRPYTPDGLPILGEVGSVPGFVMAAGHEGDGITLSGITGELIARLIVSGRTRIPLEECRYERFGGNA